MCREIKEKRGEKPDCESCLPKLLPENEDAATVYMQCRNQAVFVGMDGVPVDLDINAVKTVMDLEGIRDQRDCLQRVRAMWHHVAELDRLKRKSKK